MGQQYLFAVGLVGLLAAAVVHQLAARLAARHRGGRLAQALDVLARAARAHLQGYRTLLQQGLSADATDSQTSALQEPWDVSPSAPGAHMRLASNKIQHS